jgi:hypothetical protein
MYKDWKFYEVALTARGTMITVPAHIGTSDVTMWNNVLIQLRRDNTGSLNY